MQEWIRTMVLMARALVLSPERDSPYLGFCCHRLMELLTKKLFSTILLGGGFFLSLLPPIPQTLYEGFFVLHSYSCAP